MNVIITGSNRGIGKAMVEAFATAGYNVWACARKSTSEHEAWLKETAEKTDVWIKPVYFELTDKDALNAAIGKCAAIKGSDTLGYVYMT